jgi:hypothetical protein
MDAEAVKERQGVGQERLPDMEAGEALALQDHGLETSRSEERPGGASGRSPSEDQHVYRALTGHG